MASGARCPAYSALLAQSSLLLIYTRHTSSCRCVGFPRSPQSLTDVSSWGFAASPRYKAQ
ncbi:hypothetical protein DWG24_01365 [Dickeya zeae]|uniref:Uncharacterized protein n=1 Tax=Dickeya zeae TaxID=204042 RepID=A0AAE7CX75_9GAMM|nr:hypothetical protein C1O30_19750 [Dickeya zeae]QIZ49521.1 hypothetical protein DWG24_01365 [Dickeya zeae]